MMRFLIVTVFAVMLAACSSSQERTAAENPVDACADKGMGPAHPDYEKCLEDTARGRCSQAGASGSPEYVGCMKDQSDAAFARDQVRRWGF